MNSHNIDNWEFFARQLIMPEWGLKPQEKLAKSHIIMVGAGGLGNAIVPQLVGMGVGKITIIDDDLVELSNLARQQAFRLTDIGKPKAIILARRARQLSPFTKIIAKNTRLDAHNIARITKNANLIICGTDNIASRLLCNQFAYKNNIPFLNGAVSNFDGQIALYQRGAPCYECNMGNDDTNNLANCTTIGVFTPMVALIGAMIAVEAGLICADMPSNYRTDCGIIDGLSGVFMKIRRVAKPHCPICQATIQHNPNHQ